MPSATSTGKAIRFEPRVAVLIGAILVAGIMGESGADWKKCGNSDADLISACALDVDVLPDIVQSALLEVGHG
ncbi:hypothetical protein LA6_005021 [Marinibacterium anthonyi]|nr:hypothetical protein LA6_005021 [Marinibacterium anthonyi]